MNVRIDGRNDPIYRKASLLKMLFVGLDVFYVLSLFISKLIVLNLFSNSSPTLTLSFIKLIMTRMITSIKAIRIVGQTNIIIEFIQHKNFKKLFSKSSSYQIT